MAEETNQAERTEEVVAKIMRSTRDEKIRLDAQVKELQERVDHLDGIVREQATAFREDLAKVVAERDELIRRNSQLETELRSIVAAANDALKEKS